MNGESPEQDWFEKADQDGECKVNIRRPEKEECLELRKRLQKARYQVLEDGENWLGIAQAIEAVGNAITKNEKKVGTGLRNVEAELQQFVKKCHPTTGQGQYEAEEGPFESTFENLLEEVRKARNDEAHTGVTARAAARIAVVVGIYLEDTLMAASGRREGWYKSLHTNRGSTSLQMAEAGRVQATDVDTLFLIPAHKNRK